MEGNLTEEKGAKKVVHIINWNLISIVLTIGGIIFALILNYNKREIDILKSELIKVEKEKDKLSEEVDPEWHIKFNHQKQYYEGQLAHQSELLYITNKELDSIVKNQPALILSLENRGLGLSVIQMDNLIRILFEAEKNTELIELYETMIENYESIMSHNEQRIKNYEAIDSLRLLEIGLYQSLIENSDETDNMLFIIQILLFVLAFIAILYSYLKSKFKENTTEQEEIDS